MKNWVIVDTGYLAALANPKDQYHALAVTRSQTITEDLITTWPVITELCHYLIKRVSPKAQALLIKQILSETIQVVDVMQGNLEKAILLLDKYADLPKWIWPMRHWLFWRRNLGMAGFCLPICATSTLTAGKTISRFKICYC